MLHSQHKKLHNEKHPKLSDFLNKFIYVVAIAGPAFTIPQMLEIYISKSSENISILSWAGYVLIDIFWIGYGILHKEKPLVLTNIGFLLIRGAIVIGILLYR